MIKSHIKNSGNARKNDPFKGNLFVINLSEARTGRKELLERDQFVFCVSISQNADQAPTSRHGEDTKYISVLFGISTPLQSTKTFHR